MKIDCEWESFVYFHHDLLETSKKELKKVFHCRTIFIIHISLSGSGLKLFRWFFFSFTETNFLTTKETCFQGWCVYTSYIFFHSSFDVIGDRSFSISFENIFRVGPVLSQILKDLCFLRACCQTNFQPFLPQDVFCSTAANQDTENVSCFP